jgi:hypothetical protein
MTLGFYMMINIDTNTLSKTITSYFLGGLGGTQPFVLSDTPLNFHQLVLLSINFHVVISFLTYKSVLGL